jgi:NTE family protein
MVAQRQLCHNRIFIFTTKTPFMKHNFLILLSFLLCAFSINAADAPKIGLTLSGGGARGLSHIGVLQALEELRIPISYLSGTSMGGLVGGLYASGLTTQELKEAATGGIDWKKVFSTVPPRDELSLRDKQQLNRFILGLEVGLSSEQLISSGFLGGQELFLTLHRYTRGIEVPDFNQLPIPFKCVATDINTAEPVVLEKGNLAMALRATMSVPFAFSPIEIDNHLLVDGGILNNLPVDVVRNMGANLVIAINISSPLGKADQSSSFVTVALQSVDAALVQNTIKSVQSLKHPDVLIEPSIDEFTSADFEKAEILILRGYQAVMDKATLLSGLSISQEKYQQYQQDIKSRIPEEVKIHNIKPAFVSFQGNKRTDNKILSARISDLKDRTLKTSDLEDSARQLTRLDDIRQVTYRIAQNENREQGVLFNVDEKSWGPHYLKLGINASTGFDRRANFNTLIRHSYLNATPYGGEWINEIKLGNEYYYFTEFYQPLDYQGKFFIAPYFKLQRRFVDIYEGINKIAKASYLVQGYRGGIDVGMNISNRAEIRLGMRYVSDTPRLQAGESDLYPKTGIREPALTFSYSHDSLNARLFATKGNKIKLQGEFYDKSFGAERRYSLLSIDAAHYFSPHKQLTLETRLFAATSFGSNPPPHDYFSLGGTAFLAGYPQYSMMGSEAVFGQIGAFLNPDFIAPLKNFSDVRLFASLHSGKAWIKPERIKLQNLLTGGLGGLVWDTNFGNVFFGIGYTQGGDVRYLFSLGNEF